MRVIGADGSQIGIIPVATAIAEAQKAGLDLVEVAPDSTPPVCRIMDYGKYRYQLSKKEHSAKKTQVVVQVKEIRIRPKTDTHDREVKIRHIIRFLEQNSKVKIVMLFRGREIVYAEQGRETMEDIKRRLGDTCTVEQEPKREGRNMIMIVAPAKKK